MAGRGNMLFRKIRFRAALALLVSATACQALPETQPEATISVESTPASRVSTGRFECQTPCKIALSRGNHPEIIFTWPDNATLRLTETEMANHSLSHRPIAVDRRYSSIPDEEVITLMSTGDMVSVHRNEPLILWGDTPSPPKN
jgi:hypothetical protein